VGIPKYVGGLSNVVQSPRYATAIGLLLEGTYPYVAGGVSSWVHQIIRAFPEYRFALAFLGSTPLGAPIIGWVSEHISPRGGLVVGGLACLLAAGIGAIALARAHDTGPRRQTA